MLVWREVIFVKPASIASRAVFIFVALGVVISALYSVADLPIVVWVFASANKAAASVIVLLVEESIPTWILIAAPPVIKGLPLYSVTAAILSISVNLASISALIAVRESAP